MMRKFKSKKGFTLAELLIVIAIIAVLTAVAVPVFSASQKKAKLAVDHAAIRDAYAVVQIANNLQEVEINGTTKTFGQFTDDQLFVLSEDCSSLLKNSFPIPENAYRLQADGTDPGNTPCPDCTKWDDSAATFPASQMHIKGSPIYAFFDVSQGKIVLGFKNILSGP